MLQSGFGGASQSPSSSRGAAELSEPDDDGLRWMTLINGEKVPGLLPLTDGEEAVLDTVAVLTDSLEDGFRFSLECTDGSSGGCNLPVIHGGRSPDGCIVGVLSWAGSTVG